MVRKATTQMKIAGLLADGVARGTADIARETGLSDKSVQVGCYRAWLGGVVLRSEKQLSGSFSRFRGRSGIISNQRLYFLYTLRPDGVEKVTIDGIHFVPYSENVLSTQVPKGKSKSQKILNFLEENRDEAFFSLDIFEALESEGIKKSDIMGTVRRYEKKGQIFVRGYRSDMNQTAFERGFLITWIHEDVPRKRAIEEAFERTNKILNEPDSSNVTGQRIRAIRDQVIADAQMREITSMEMLRRKLGCNKSELDYAIERTLQLYPDVKDEKIFGYRYFYHTDIAKEDLEAAIKLKQKYISKTKGRHNRIGHNWEAAVEWFVDKFTPNARFWTQEHRDKTMDKRRIILHLIKPVGGRRRNAEVDRMWSIKPSPYSPEVTYVLQSKWGLVTKRALDDHIEVLRWSKEFGSDTQDGREIKQGTIAIFAGGAFNPNTTITIGEDEISLPQYAARMKIEIIKAADFNKQIHEKGVETYVTIQKICRAAKDEEEVKEAITKIWNQPEKARFFLNKIRKENQELYEFEEKLNN